MATETEDRIDRQAIAGRNLADILRLEEDNQGRFRTGHGPKTAYGLVELVKELSGQADKYIATGRI